MGLSHSPNIVTDGMILCLDAANPRSYPGTGTQWNDISGNNHQATLVNGVSFSSNNAGIFDYDGVDDYIKVPNHPDFQFTDKFTQINWFKLNTPFTDRYRTLMGKSTFSRWGIIVEWFGNNRLLFDFFTTDGSRNALLLDANHNGWVMAAHTYDKLLGTHTAWVFDVDGVRTTSGSSTLDIFTDSQEVRIGDASAHIDMDVGPALLYNRALSDAEIKQNFQAFRGRYGI